MSVRSDLKKTRLLHLGNVETTSSKIFCATDAWGLYQNKFKQAYSRLLLVKQTEKDQNMAYLN